MANASKGTAAAAEAGGETRRRHVRRVRKRSDRTPTHALSPTASADDAMNMSAGAKNHALEVEQLRKARTEFYSRPPEERTRRMQRASSDMVNVTAARSMTALPAVHRAKAKEPRARDKNTPRLGKSSRTGTTGITARDSTRKRAAAEASAYVYGPPDRQESDSTARKPARSSTAPPPVSRERRSRSGMSQSTLQSQSATKRASDKTTKPLSTRRTSSPQIGNATAKSSTTSSRSATPKVVRSTSMQERPTSASPRPGVQRSNTTLPAESPSPSASPTTSAMGKTASGTGAKQRRSSVGLFAALFGPSPQRPEKKVACLTCAADDVPMSKSAKLACGHRMCHDCLKRVFTMSISDPQHMPPRCCTQDHIPLRHVDRLFTDKFKMQWNKKYQEYTTKNRIYCPTRSCGEWIKPGNIQMDSGTGRKYGKCNRCKTKICCLCNGKWHTRRECPNDEETKNFIEVAKKEGWQRCFNCKAMVELKEGCNHMTCRCGAEFCMICARRWKTCDCPWFNHGAVVADDGDRLNHFNIPQPLAGAYNRGHIRRATADDDNDIDLGGPRHRGGQGAGAALAYHQELELRRQQEQEDEALARRLQILGFQGSDQDDYSYDSDAAIDAVLNDYAARRRARRQHQHQHQQHQHQQYPRERERNRLLPRTSVNHHQQQHDYPQQHREDRPQHHQTAIFGIGNTTDHFMNETYIRTDPSPANTNANLSSRHQTRASLSADHAAAIAHQMRGIDDRQALNGSWAPPGLLSREPDNPTPPRRSRRSSFLHRRRESEVAAAPVPPDRAESGRLNSPPPPPPPPPPPLAAPAPIPAQRPVHKRMNSDLGNSTNNTNGLARPGPGRRRHTFIGGGDVNGGGGNTAAGGGNICGAGAAGNTTGTQGTQGTHGPHTSEKIGSWLNNIA